MMITQHRYAVGFLDKSTARAKDSPDGRNVSEQRDPQDEHLELGKSSMVWIYFF